MIINEAKIMGEKLPETIAAVKSVQPYEEPVINMNEFGNEYVIRRGILTVVDEFGRVY